MRLHTLKGSEDCGLVYILHCQPVAAVLRFLLRMVLETGFIKHVRMPTGRKAILTLTSPCYHGTYTQIEMRRGTKKKPEHVETPDCTRA